MRRFASLRRQADFARLRRQGRRITTESLVIYRSGSLAVDGTSLVGITVSKSIGKAVIRNKLRRRLAAILDEALTSHPAMRLLVVARALSGRAPYRDLRAEVLSALSKG